MPVEKLVSPSFLKIFEKNDSEGWIERARIVHPEFKVFLDEAVRRCARGEEVVIYFEQAEDLAEAVVAWILDRTPLTEARLKALKELPNGSHITTLLER